MNLNLLRYLLILATLVAMALVISLAFNADLPVKLAEKAPLRGLIYIDNPGSAPTTISMFGIFHYVLMACILVVETCVLILLARRVSNMLLIYLSCGISFAAWSAGLYYLLFRLEWVADLFMLRLTLAAAIILAGSSMYSFIRTFAVYPAPFSLDRKQQYYRRIRKMGLSFRHAKKSLLGRLRRSMLLWQLREIRKSKAIESNVRGFMDWLRSMFDEMNVFIYPGWLSILASAMLAAYWVNEFFLGFGRRLGAMLVMAFFLVAFISLMMILEKIKTDYELGDDSIRRKVFWIDVGLYTPQLFFIWMWLMAILILPIYPPAAGLVMASIFSIFPPLWFAFFVLCLMVSIFFFGAIDPGRMLKTSTLYALLGFVLTAIFVFAEQVISPLIVRYTGLPGTLGAVIAGTLVAVVFGPLRSRIDVKIENVVGKTRFAGNQVNSEPDNS